MTESPTMSSPGVRIPPPFFFALGLIAGYLLSRVGPPLLFGSGSSSDAGIALIVVGASFAAWGMLTFRAARTAINPTRSASRIVTAGPYRFTRNPMYVGLTTVYLGSSLLIGTWWCIILLPVVLALLVRFVIRREEAYLDAAFHDDYAAYRGHVRRWV